MEFPLLSSAGNSLNCDFHVSFDPEQVESGGAEYNYRGLDPFNTAYQLLDLAPDGRNESGPPYPMDWVRRRDEY